MTLRTTYTFAELKISAAAYDEIAAKLRAADYGHVFGPDGEMDMHGIALTRGRPKRPGPPPYTYSAEQMKLLQAMASRHPRRSPRHEMASLVREIGRCYSDVSRRLQELRRQRADSPTRPADGRYHGLGR